MPKYARQTQTIQARQHTNNQAFQQYPSTTYHVGEGRPSIQLSKSGVVSNSKAVITKNCGAADIIMQLILFVFYQQQHC